MGINWISLQLDEPQSVWALRLEGFQRSEGPREVVRVGRCLTERGEVTDEQLGKSVDDDRRAVMREGPPLE